MAIDFPSSPDIDDTFSAAGSTWKWNGTVWVRIGFGGGTSVAVGDTPPASPNDGDLWYDDTSGVLFIWYEDVDSGQWVDVGSSGPQGQSVVNIDGGTPTSVYGGITSLDAGGV